MAKDLWGGTFFLLLPPPPSCSWSQSLTPSMVSWEPKGSLGGQRAPPKCTWTQAQLGLFYWCVSPEFLSSPQCSHRPESWMLTSVHCWPSAPSQISPQQTGGAVCTTALPYLQLVPSRPPETDCQTVIQHSQSSSPTCSLATCVRHWGVVTRVRDRPQFPLCPITRGC